MKRLKIYDKWYWPLLMLAAMAAGTFGGSAWLLSQLLVCVG